MRRSVNPLGFIPRRIPSSTAAWKPTISRGMCCSSPWMTTRIVSFMADERTGTGDVMPAKSTRSESSRGRASVRRKPNVCRLPAATLTHRADPIVQGRPLLRLLSVDLARPRRRARTSASGRMRSCVGRADVRSDPDERFVANAIARYDATERRKRSRGWQHRGGRDWAERERWPTQSRAIFRTRLTARLTSASLAGACRGAASTGCSRLARRRDTTRCAWLSCFPRRGGLARREVSFWIRSGAKPDRAFPMREKGGSNVCVWLCGPPQRRGALRGDPRGSGPAHRAGPATNQGRRFIVARLVICRRSRLSARPASRG